MKGVLRVLMWKHLVVRIRRFIHTPIEIFSPIIFFILLYVYRDLMDAPTPKSMNFDGLNTTGTNIHQTEMFSILHTKVPPRILYTPDTPLTNQLMDTVGYKLHLKHLEYLPDNNVRGYYPFSNESAITEYTKTMSADDAIVIFQDLSADTWPQKLNYTIRMKTNFLTHQYESLDGTVGPHENFGSIYEPFMRLQWAVDTSYIELLTGNSINLTLYLQEFPYAESSENSIIPIVCMLLQFICWVSLMLVFVFLMARLLEERTTGIQELVRMVGVSSNMLGISHFLNVLPAGLAYSIIGTILLKVSSHSVIKNSDGVLIFLMLMLHFISVVSMAFACSYLSQNTQYTVSLSVFAYVALWLPARNVSTTLRARWLVLLSGLFPHVPMQWFWDEVASLEQYGRGLSFSDITSSHSANSGPMLLGYGYMLLQIAIFFALSWYLALVRPGKYGQPLPWNFLFQRHYWTQQRVNPDSIIDDQEEEPIVTDPRYYEGAPGNAEVGIKIVNVSKIFPKHKALSNVSLDVYKGEITILLGHNGAGKTTLMSIITGMLAATEGKVYVNGMDTSSHLDEVRKQLGLCPQHNLSFPDLTVLEHVMFFTLLKGGTFNEARKSSTQLLKKLSLYNKASSKSADLSGGMKRRLQLACALSGGASVLIFDEPTSGLDVETRRELWDLLLSLRGDRTVLLTTHFMEEADALGDRVAALHAGRLRCYASTMYLKRAIGTGYRLSFTTIGHPNESTISNIITAHIPDAAVKERTLNSLTYNLPAASSSSFPELFNNLESQRSSLAIDSIGVGKSTLEEVFLKLCSDTDTSIANDELDSTTVEPTHEKLSGLPLYIRQHVVLFRRQMKYIWSKKISFLILQIFLPILMICLFTRGCNDERDAPERNGPITLNLDVYKNMRERRALYDVTADGADMRPTQGRFPDVQFERSQEIANAVLRYGIQDILEYNKYLVGIELNDTSAKVLYTTIVRHAAPIALNMFSNILSTQYLPAADWQTITTINHPIETVYVTTTFAQPKSNAMALMWAIFIAFIIQSTIAAFVSLPCKERASGARHIHIMSGCPPVIHWGTTLVFHTVVALLTLLFPTLIIAATLDTDSTLNQPHNIGTLLLIILLGCMAFLAFMYLVSCYCAERAAGIVLVAVILLFGFLTPSIQFASELFTSDRDWTDYLIDVVSYIFSPHQFTMAAIKCVHVARLNALCELNRDKCPNLHGISDVGFDAKQCCATDGDMQSYISGNRYAPGKELIIMLVQFFVYMTLVILTQLGVFNMLHDKLFNASYKPQHHRYNDEMVRGEKAYVEKAITLPKNQIQEAMLVHDVHKNYHSVFRKSCNAVRGISFSVKKGECFGLLGVNGAGKSTTFKMLTAEECATKGRIYANGHYLNLFSGQYLQTLGYCPQFFGLDAFQTGRENLTLLLTLRGLNSKDVSSEVDSWIQVVGLDKYANRAVSGYSGGCVRRLGAAAALAAGGAVTLLDEPTAGVDVAARRRVWAALRRAQRTARAVVITSHSMDEMESLCNRIAIMSAGEMCALGSPAALRAAHAAGHALAIKIRATAAAATGDEIDSAKMELDRLKGALTRKFSCVLKDEHKTMLHYHINETLKYSDLFTELESLKTTFPLLVEDYSVTETTLEEVFLSFAKHTQDSEWEPAAV